MTTNRSKNGRSLRYELCKLLWPHIYKATSLQEEFESEPGEFDGPWRDGDEEIVEALDRLLSIRSRHEIFTKKVASLHEKLGDAVSDELNDDLHSDLDTGLPAAQASKKESK